jgi:hypothetical protein
MARNKGIFCLEGDWWNNLKNRSSVEPILELLMRTNGYSVRYVHLNVDHRYAFEYYLKKWTQSQFRDHPILYLAFHGEPGTLLIGDQRKPENKISIEELGEMLEGQCDKRIIFMGSCESMNIHGNTLNSFLNKTGALAICGYWGDVDWLPATAFELIVLATLQENALTISGAKAMKGKISGNARSLEKKLRFRMVIRRK